MKSASPVFLNLLLVGLLHGLPACAPREPAPKPPEQDPRFEVTSSVDESVSAVSKTPLKFTIPLKQDSAAWARANFFLTQYTLSKKVSRKEIPGGDRLTGGTFGPDKYAYEVKRIVDSRGSTYAVRCILKNPPGKVDKKAEQNAKSLARFIREGELELSLISR